MRIGAAPAGQPDSAASDGARRCRNCDAELGERGERDLCPECGLPVIVSVCGGEAGGLTDEAGCVSGDTPCNRCGYNLRGLPREGCCPECAAPVDLSIFRGLLCFAEPRWVDALARGNDVVSNALKFWAVALLCAMAAGALLILAMWLPPMFGVRLLLAVIVPALIVVAVGCTGGSMIMFPIGMWDLTAAQPGVFDRDRSEQGRRLVRAAILAPPALIGLKVLVVVLGGAPLALTLVLPADLAYVVLLAFASRAYFRLMQHIAVRVPHDGVAKQAEGLAMFMPTILVMVAVVIAGAAMFPLGNVRLGVAPLSAALSVPGMLVVGMLAVLVQAARMHRHLNKSLRQQAELAARHWAGGVDEGRDGEGSEAREVNG